MKCIRCGYELQPGTAVCPYCGTQQPYQPQDYYSQAPQQGYGQPQYQQNYGQAPQQNYGRPQQQYRQPQPQSRPTYNQPPAAPKGGGKKTGIIITIIICALVLIGGTIGGVILYKKSQEKNATTEATTEVAAVKPDRTTEEKTEATTEEPTTEATTEEPEPVPYAEEYDLKFSPLGTEASGNAYAKMYYSDQYEGGEDGEETLKPLDVDDVVVENCTYEESITKVIKTNPDSNGLVKYYVEEYSVTEADILDSNLNVYWTYIPNYWASNFFDYYGGYKFRDTLWTNGFTEEKVNKFRFDVNDEEVEISVRCMIDGAYRSENTMTTEETDEGKRYHFRQGKRQLYIVECPEDYDGLAMAMPNGDVNPERIDRTQEADEKGELSVSDGSEKTTRKLFDENKLGYTDKPEDSIFFRLDDIAVPYSPEAIADYFSNKSYIYDDSFLWVGAVQDGDETMGGERITDRALIEGDWECRIFYNESSEFGYGEELNFVNISFDGDKATYTEEYYYCLWGKDGQWEYAGDDEPESFTGYFNDEAELTFDSGESPEDLKLRFYTNGYCQHAVGTWGDGVYVYLFRP